MRFLLGLAGWVGACGGGHDESIRHEDTVETCSNEIDDDGDGFVDCRDQDCAVFALCVGGDSDVDTDTDADTDSDVDTDSDSDSDSETGSDTGPDCDSDPDRDDDGFDDIACGGPDCDDVRDDVYPGAGDNVDLYAWSYEPIAPLYYYEHGLALDSADVPHVTYSSLPIVNYAVRRGPGDWDVDVVHEAEGHTVRPSALSIDVDDVSHVAYGDTDVRTELGVLTNAGGVWEGEIYEDAQGTEYAAIDTDPDGNSHVCYPGGGAGTLGVRYATDAGGAWDTETIDSWIVTVGTCSIAVDDEGGIHVAYYESELRELHYAKRNAGAWDIEIVDDTTPDVGWEQSIDVDRDGAAHIAYYASDPGEARYATNASGAWDWVTIEPRALAGGWVSGRKPAVALDENGSPFVTYRQDGDLRLAVRDIDAWSVQTVTEDATGDESHLVVSAGIAHISLVGIDSSNMLEYVWGAVPDGVDQDCDGEDG